MSSPPLTRLRAGLRVGASFFDTPGLRVLPPENTQPQGLVDDASELSRPGLDAAAMHPDVRVFFEQTSRLELQVFPAWGPGFWPFAWVFRLFASLVGQLRLPMQESRIATQIFALDEQRDGRPKARACIRTYEGESGPMQVAVYAVHRRDGVGYLSVAFPFPLCALNGLLRLDAIGQDEAGRLAVALTSEPRTGPERGAGAEGERDDAGVYLAIGRAAVRLPLAETMKLWAPGMAGAPPPRPGSLPGATIVGHHEQRLFGVRFVAYTYYFRPLPPGTT